MRIVLGILLMCSTVIAIGCGPKSVPEPAPLPPPEVDFGMLEAMPGASCPYWSSQGPALVCFSLRSYKDHYITYVTHYDLAARRAKQRELISVNPPTIDNETLSEVAYDATGVEDLNRELRRRSFQPSRVVYKVAVRDGVADQPRRELGRGLSVGVEGTALTLRRGDAVLEQVRWDDLRNVTIVLADVIDLGGAFGVVVDLRGPDGKHDTLGTVFEIWTGGDHACPARITCAPHRALTEHYLGGICSEAFDTFELLDSLMDGVRADTAAGRLDKADLRLLSAAHAALLGERSGQADLDAYFFDGDANTWLPAACFGRFPSRDSLTIAQLAGQQNLTELRDAP